MKVETLLYMQNSKFYQSSIVLQPELTKSKLFFDAELVDPRLVIECFSQLFNVVQIKRGRNPLYTRRQFYDPIITIQEKDVQFEIFSMDMTHYARVVLNEGAFKNIKYWEPGVTNVDFTPDFIEALRNAGPKVKSINIDPDGFEVDISDQESVFEKKVELPENWEIALDNLRRCTKPRKNNTQTKGDALRRYFRSPEFNRFSSPPYAKPELTWVPRSGLVFQRLKLRANLGHAIMGYTLDITERMDGRKNPRYDAIRQGNMLKTIKTYILFAEQIDDDSWTVRSSSANFKVSKDAEGHYQCNCRDYIFRGKAKGNKDYHCKHIETVLKPKLDVRKTAGNHWVVHILGDNKVIGKEKVSFTNKNFKCSCREHRETNICPHVVEVMKVTEDFQFKELFDDLSYKVRVVEKDDTSLNLLKPTRKIKITDDNLKPFIKKRVVVHRGSIEFMERKVSTYGDKHTEFFIITLKNVILGPKLEENAIQTSLSSYLIQEDEEPTLEKIKIPNMVIRLSDSAFHGLTLNIGDSIKLIGTIKEHKRFGHAIIRVAKPEILKKAPKVIHKDKEPIKEPVEDATKKEEDDSPPISSLLNNLSFSFTGKLNTMKRAEAEKLVKDNGGIVRKNVSKGLDYLVTNDTTPTIKYQKAQDQKTKIISEQEFLDMLN